MEEGEKKNSLPRKINKEVKNIVNSRIWFFFIGGLLVFFFEWFLTIILTEKTEISPNFAYFIALIFGGLLLFAFHKKITFGFKERVSFHTYKRFIIAYILTYALIWILVFLLTYKINYIYAIPFSNLVIGSLSYFLNKYWVFVVKN